jgi:hypothetical protein
MVRVLLALLALGWTPLALADWMPSAAVPAAAKSAAPEAFRLVPGTLKAGRLALDVVDPAEIDAVREANSSSFNKRLQIGIGREVPAKLAPDASTASWEPVSDGRATQWEIQSPGAHALRVGLDVRALPAGTEIRFAGRGDPLTVYGPFTASDVPAGGASWWSPVLEGDTAIVEVFVPAGAWTGDVALSIGHVSHLFASPTEANVESLAKASQPCEVDLICRSASDAALASIGRAVARMTFSDGLGGGTYLCTGTLLNSNGGASTPYFYSANHCMSTQASASTLTTFWFYDRTGCGTGVLNPSNVQLTGGATLLYANAASDALLLRLNATPPAGAVLAGWDATTLSTGVAMTAVHHPAGDLKKVSLATMGGFGSPVDSSTNFIISSWNSTATGVTEGGSSGSGIFTAVGSPASDYRLRGGLYGGPSSCTASGSNLRDYYSRFDQVYPSIAQYLAATPPACSYVLSPTSVTVGASATSGTVTVTTSAGCAWSATSSASWLTTASSGTGSGTISYSVAANSGSARSGTLTVGGVPFTVSQQAPVTSTTNLVPNPGFESGTAGWSQSATGGAPIIYGDGLHVHSGSWYAWLGGYNSGTDTLYQEVTIPANASTASVRFWYNISTEEASSSTAYDTMTVSIANASTGARLATLATFSNLNRTGGWTQSPAYDVSAFRGQTVRLVFSMTADPTNVTNFFVDDIALTAVVSGSAAANYTALWLNLSEAGWGLNVNHQGSKVFATLFTYDATGRALWLHMSDGSLQPDGATFTGTLYRTTGPAFNAVPFAPFAFPANYATVGTMSITFTSASTGTLTYSVNGAVVNKSIVAYVFGSRAANCVGTTASRASLTNYQDLWLNTSEPGWGVNLTHQDDILFATLFTYDSAGRDLWLVMSRGDRQLDGSYLGDLYQTTGPAFNAVPFTPIVFPANYTKVGTMRFTFTGGTTGVMTYTVNGAAVTKTITRYEFSSPVPACS